jgi:hypothetical protein
MTATIADAPDDRKPIIPMDIHVVGRGQQMAEHGIC